MNKKKKVNFTINLAVDGLVLGVLRGVLLLLEVVDEDLLLELSNEGIPAC